MIATLLALALVSQEPGPVTFTLKRELTALDFAGSRAHSMMYMPTAVQLVAGKPAGVRKEPAYHGAPLYGEVSLGNGPKAKFVVVLDPTDASSSLFIDQNQNGDLTDDAPIAWQRIEPTQAGRLPSYRGTVVFQASYQAGNRTWKAPYGLNFYWSPGRTQLGSYRATWLVGSAMIGGQRVAARLLEDGNDGVFNRRFDTASDALNLRPVTLFLNEMQRDARGTFDWGGVNYLATIAPDGSSVTLTPTARVVKAPARPATPEKELLAVGTLAPDFTAESAQTGGPARLSDYRGKIVVLKFWATWCGPCIASMPHFEKLYQAVRNQNVEIMAVCVSDERDAYKQWLKVNQTNYTYPFFFDPAGRTPNQGISSRLYNVRGIPTVFIIDASGKVAASVVGYSEGDRRVNDALAKLGVKVP